MILLALVTIANVVGMVIETIYTLILGLSPCEGLNSIAAEVALNGHDDGDGAFANHGGRELHALKIIG